MPQPPGQNGPSADKLRDEVILDVVLEDAGDLAEVQGTLAAIVRACVHEHRRIGAIRRRHAMVPERLQEAQAIAAARTADMASAA